MQDMHPPNTSVCSSQPSFSDLTMYRTVISIAGDRLQAQPTAIETSLVFESLHVHDDRDFAFIGVRRYTPLAIGNPAIRKLSFD
jgi:hypothetical protein